MNAIINNISTRLKTITPKVYLVTPTGAVMPYIEFELNTIGNSADEELKELVIDIWDEGLSMATILDWEQQVTSLFKRHDECTIDFSYSSYKESELTIKDKDAGTIQRSLTYRLDTYIKEV